MLFSTYMLSCQSLRSLVAFVRTIISEKRKFQRAAKTLDRIMGNSTIISNKMMFTRTLLCNNIEKLCNDSERALLNPADPQPRTLISRDSTSRMTELQSKGCNTLHELSSLETNLQPAVRWLARSCATCSCSERSCGTSQQFPGTGLLCIS
jgi:hypothetical protein